jgi:hypothetical protein
MTIFRVGAFLASIIFVTASANAQENAPKPCEEPNASQFDFWLGEWDLTWPAEQTGGKKGETGKGTNSISKMLGRCVVREDFNSLDASLIGHSVSLYNATQGMWQQTWVDNQGSYLLFTGKFEAGRMILKTEPFLRGEKTAINRMVFRNISSDSLDWDWQTSVDNGATWKDLWNIHYAKKQFAQSQ